MIGPDGKVDPAFTGTLKSPKGSKDDTPYPTIKNWGPVMTQLKLYLKEGLLDADEAATLEAKAEKGAGQTKIKDVMSAAAKDKKTEANPNRVKPYFDKQ